MKTAGLSARLPAAIIGSNTRPLLVREGDAMMIALLTSDLVSCAGRQPINRRPNENLSDRIRMD